MRNIKLFGSFINENENDNYKDTPEEYIKLKLNKIKRKIDSFFDSESDNEMSFSSMGMTLVSSELNRSSMIYDNIKVKFTDDKYRYDLLVTIPINFVEMNPETIDFNEDDITKCIVKFKIYDLDEFEIYGQTSSKTINIDDLTEEFIIQLKLDIDSEYGNNEDELSFDEE